MSIVENRKATHDYFIEERYEAGLALEGWEVKSIRAGRVQLGEAYVIVRNQELFLIGCHISPLPAASTHVHPDPARTRKRVWAQMRVCLRFFTPRRCVMSCGISALWWSTAKSERARMASPVV